MLSAGRDAAAASYATHCSLRGGHAVHPLKQNPPSILEAAEEADAQLAAFDDVDIHDAAPALRPPRSRTNSTTFLEALRAALCSAFDRQMDAVPFLGGRWEGM